MDLLIDLFTTPVGGAICAMALSAGGIVAVIGVQLDIL